LINDVIDLSSLEFGKMQFSIAEHDAVATCRNVTDTVGKVKQTQAELLFETSLEELYIETDDSRLQQVLINLLINATKFTPDGSITLKLEKQSEEMALFSVTDTGCGIAPELHSRLFGRFEKLDEKAQGTGLGLSICRLIIKRLGGDISIDPSYTDGARFVFTHPLGERSEV
jgi:signal transduction histidine kinase